MFSGKVKKVQTKDGEIKELHAKIGQLAVENEFFVTRSEAMSPSTARQSICSIDERGNATK